MSIQLQDKPERYADHGNTGRRHTVKSRIIDYLASNGASKVAEISAAVTASRNCVRYHLAALERAAIVRSNISPGTREGCTPFYSLAAKNGASDA